MVAVLYAGIHEFREVGFIVFSKQFSVDPSTDSGKSLGIFAELHAREWKILEEPNSRGRISCADANLMLPELEGYPSPYGRLEHKSKHVHV
jgi:hypothetical protein